MYTYSVLRGHSFVIYLNSYKNILCLLVVIMFITSDLCQIRNEMPELARGAAKALFELYDVVTHELLSSDLRYLIGQMMQKVIGMITFFEICKFC